MIVSNSCKCEKCGKLLSYEDRIGIKAYEFIEDHQCSGSRSRTVDSFSFCKPCYEKYNNLIFEFLK